MTVTRTDALFFDIDDTLACRNPESEEVRMSLGGLCCDPTPAVVKALTTLIDSGKLVFLCTGRPPCLLSQAFLDIPVAGMVGSAGAWVSLDGEVIRDETMAPEQTLSIAKVALERHIPVVFEGNEKSVALGDDPTHFPIVPMARDVEELERMMGTLRVVKALALDPQYDELCEGGTLDEFSLANAGRGVHEITIPQANKREGIAAVLSRIGDRVATTYGFGDSENDLPMLECVDVSVVMANAAPHVREVADYVCPDVDHDGVVDGLRHYGLI